MYKRVLLKLSGEALGERNSNNIIEADSFKKVANCIKRMHDSNVEIAVVIGAGNIWRGKIAEKVGIERIPADFMGMLGTSINCIAMASVLNQMGVPAKVFSALPEINGVTINYNADKVKDALKQGTICFLSGGTGKPFFTTDTASTLRALELDCDAILMAKNGVKGVYDKDPNVYPDAHFYPVITFKEMQEKNLQVMDQSAIDLIKDSKLEILVFSMKETENFEKAVRGENIGTVCKKGE